MIRNVLRGTPRRLVAPTPHCRALSSTAPSLRALVLRDPLYTHEATAYGSGRCGPVTSGGDSPLKLELARPRVIGGDGSGQTPEQLLAMGYSSCFLSAIQFAASKANKVDLAHSARVSASVSLGPPVIPDDDGVSGQELDGFALNVELTVEGCPDEDVITHAHSLCPFSRAFRDGVVTVRSAETVTTGEANPTSWTVVPQLN